MPSLLIRHATVFTGESRAPVLGDHAILCAHGRVTHVIPDDELEHEHVSESTHEVDARGALVTPGLIDCHTHLIFGGSRAHEFEMRLAGAGYGQIAAAGGGILSTVRATRSASDESLLEDAAARLAQFARQGVTTVEIKSGYGLDTDTELRILRLARDLAHRSPLHVVPTFLGAHAVGPEFLNDRAGYIAQIKERMLPQVAREKLSRTFDIFCEKGAFTLEETVDLLMAARLRGMRIRVHAEQFGYSGAAALAAKSGALSADHLEYLKPEEAALFCISGTIAVLLPGAQLTLGLPCPPVKALREAGVPIAIATDCNPGTSMTTDLLGMIQLGARMYKLSPAECLSAVTANAAKALGMNDRFGRLAPGYEADVAIWDAEAPVDLVYSMGRNPLRQSWRSAKQLHAGH